MLVKRDKQVSPAGPRHCYDVGSGPVGILLTGQANEGETVSRLWKRWEGVHGTKASFMAPGSGLEPIHERPFVPARDDDEVK